MSLRRARFAALLMLACAHSAAADAPPPAAPGPARERIEARSSDLLAVGTVNGSRMIIHLSRLADNAPVRDAAVNVVLRGTAHPATADADGGYSIDTPDLALPGAAEVQFQVTRAGGREDLNGTLGAAAAAAGSDGGGNSRQYGWWLLNFAVCIGFLMLWRRRGKPDS